MKKDVQEEAFHLIRRLIQEHTAAWQHVLPDLTKPQYSVLKAVAAQPGIEQVELTHAAIATKATLAELLTRLEARKLVRRESEENDKRRRYVYLTRAGEAELRAAASIVKKVDDSFLDRLPARKRDEFTSMLNILLEQC